MAERKRGGKPAKKPFRYKKVIFNIPDGSSKAEIKRLYNDIGAIIFTVNEDGFHEVKWQAYRLATDLTRRKAFEILLEAVGKFSKTINGNFAIMGNNFQNYNAISCSSKENLYFTSRDDAVYFALMQYGEWCEWAVVHIIIDFQVTQKAL